MATPVQSGAQSATWYATAAGNFGSTVTDDVNVDWDALPSGKLKDVLNRTYAAIGPKTAIQVFMEAFATAGGSVAVSGDVSGCTGTWDISGAGFPVIYFNSPDSAATAYAIRIQTSYSASE